MASGKVHPLAERLGEATRGFTRHLDEFGQQSSAHGVRYLLDRSLPWWHRAAWLLVVAAALVGYSVMVKQNYQDLQRSPIITYDSFPSSERDAPLPAVSVCRDWVVPKGTSDFVNKLKANRTNEQDMRDYLAALFLCEIDELKELGGFRDYTHVWDVFVRLSGVELEVSKSASLKVYPDLFGYCLTTDTDKRGILTPQVPWKEVLIQEGQGKLTTEEEYYLSMTIRKEPTEKDKTCKRKEEGTAYTVFVHDPGEYPGNERDGGVTVKQGSNRSLEWFVEDAVEPLDEVASLPAHRRKCFYAHDAPALGAFRCYTPGNCLVECEVQGDLKREGCVQMRRRIYPINTTICAGYTNTNQLPSGETSGVPCDCLQLCSHVVYGLRLLQQFDEDPKTTRVQVFRKRHTFTKKIRSVVITETGFLANCAGLLGLFLGVSVLSMFEVVYHLVVRAAGSTTLDPDQYVASSELDQLRSTQKQKLQEVRSSLYSHQETLHSHRISHDLRYQELEKALGNLLKKINGHTDDRHPNQDSCRTEIPPAFNWMY